MTHPASPQTLPAPVDARSRTPMADLDRGSVGDLKLLMAVLKELGRLGSNVPGPRGRTILWAINQLAWRVSVNPRTTVGLMLC